MYRTFPGDGCRSTMGWRHQALGLTHLLQPRSQDQGSWWSWKQKDLLMASDICRHAIYSVVPGCSVTISGCLICQRQKDDLRKRLTPGRQTRPAFSACPITPPTNNNDWSWSSVNGNAKLNFHKALFYFQARCHLVIIYRKFYWYHRLPHYCW